MNSQSDPIHEYSHFDLQRSTLSAIIHNSRVPQACKKTGENDVCFQTKSKYNHNKRNLLEIWSSRFPSISIKNLTCLIWMQNHCIDSCSTFIFPLETRSTASTWLQPWHEYMSNHDPNIRKRRQNMQRNENQQNLNTLSRYSEAGLLEKLQ